MTPVFQQVNRLYARIAELETELKEAGDYLNRNDRLDERIAALEAELKAARETIDDKQAWIERTVKNVAEEANRQKAELEAENAELKAAMDNIRDEAQRALGEQFTSPTQAVCKLAHKYSAADARADAAERERDNWRSDANRHMQVAESAEAEAARLRQALAQVEWLWIGAQNQNEPTSLICPWCKQARPHPWYKETPQGHSPDCARQAALQDAPVEKEGENAKPN